MKSTKIKEKEYTYSGYGKGKIVIVKGTVYADDKKNALWKAKQETSLSSFTFKEITIFFTDIKTI